MCDGTNKYCTCGILFHENNHHAHGVDNVPFRRLFSEIHEEYDTQFENAVSIVSDDADTAAARSKAATCPNTENLLSLGGALCFQLRYKEAAKVYSQVLSSDPLNYTANRKLALCMLKTRDFSKARELFALCDRLNPDDLDIVYRQGLCEFYDGNFSAAERFFLRCYPYAQGNGDIYIAVMYWHILTLVRLNKDISDALSKHSQNIEIGHHFGYLLACRLFAGEDTVGHLTASTSDADEMTRTILLYGVYHYFLMQNKRTGACAALREMLSLKTYWGSFAWIAAYGDGIRENLFA